MTELLLLIQTVALVCGPQTMSNTMRSNEEAINCQERLLTCAKEICSKKKCQDRAVTLEKCIKGEIK